MNIDLIYLVIILSLYLVWFITIIVSVIGYCISCWANARKNCCLDNFNDEKEMKNFQRKYSIWMTKDFLDSSIRYNIYFSLFMTVFVCLGLIITLIFQENNWQVISIIFSIISFAFNPLWHLIKSIFKFERKISRHKDYFMIFDYDTYQKCKEELKINQQELKINQQELNKIDEKKYPGLHKKQKKIVEKINTAIKLYTDCVEFEEATRFKKKTKT